MERFKYPHAVANRLLNGLENVSLRSRSNGQSQALTALLRNPIKFVEATSLTFEDEKGMAPSPSRKSMISPKLEEVLRSDETQLQGTRRVAISAISNLWTPERSTQSSRGFPNVNRVTCYMNSILQTILHAPRFVNWLDSHFDCGKDDCIVCALRKLANVYWQTEHTKTVVSKARNVVMQALAKAKWSREYGIVGQQDVHDLWLHLVGTLQDQAPWDEGIRRALLTTPYRSVFECPDCKKQSFSNTELDSSLQIHLPVPTSKKKGIKDAESLSLIALVKDEFAASPRDSFPCPSSPEGCGSWRNRTARRQWLAAPEILCMQLLRSTSDWGSQGTKNESHVNFAEYIDLSDYVEGNGDRRAYYKLLSVIQHQGSLESGHYYVVARNPSGAWEEIEDTVVSKANFQAARDPRGRFTPYLLFWEKVKITAGQGSDLGKRKRNE